MHAENLIGHKNYNGAETIQYVKKTFFNPLLYLLNGLFCLVVLCFRFKSEKV